eukprot:649552-Pyramimonas_sp.AAC.1
MISKGVSEVVSLGPELQAPWKTRCGLRLTVKTAEKDVRYPEVRAPTALPHVPRPRRLPDPASKTSQRKELLRIQRRERLPVDLRQAFDEADPPADQA